MIHFLYNLGAKVFCCLVLWIGAGTLFIAPILVCWAIYKVFIRIRDHALIHLNIHIDKVNVDPEDQSEKGQGSHEEHTNVKRSAGN